VPLQFTIKPSVTSRLYSFKELPPGRLAVIVDAPLGGYAGRLVQKPIDRANYVR
jgi:hypothetical protein